MTDLVLSETALADRPIRDFRVAKVLVCPSAVKGFSALIEALCEARVEVYALPETIQWIGTKCFSAVHELASLPDRSEAFVRCHRIRAIVMDPTQADEREHQLLLSFTLWTESSQRRVFPLFVPDVNNRWCQEVVRSGFVGTLLAEQGWDIARANTRYPARYPGQPDYWEPELV